MGLGDVSDKRHPETGARQRGDDASTASPRATSPRTGATPRTPRPAPSGWPPRSRCPAPWPATAPVARPGTHDIAVLHPQGRIEVQVELAERRRRGRRHAGVAGAHRPQDPAGRSPPARLRLLHAARTGRHRRGNGRGGAVPRRPVTIIVPTAAGGANDAIARAVARRLGPRLGRTVTVDNRSGAHGSVASEYVARARPDGHTLLLGYIATHAHAPRAAGPRLRPRHRLRTRRAHRLLPHRAGHHGGEPVTDRRRARRPARRRAERLPLRLGGRRHRTALRRRTVQARTPGSTCAGLTYARILPRAQRHRERTHAGHVRQPVQRQALDRQRTAPGPRRRGPGPAARATGRAHPARGGHRRRRGHPVVRAVRARRAPRHRSSAG